MDQQRLMQACVLCALVLLIGAGICLLLGISEGVFLFILAFLVGLIVIILWVLTYYGIIWSEPKHTFRAETPKKDTLEDLKIRYAKGEITTAQFRQMKKELGKSSP
ncbi:MAG: SHOCT domain-containing protein [Candidatus Thermoplasmatota archaeon]|nr:SHOCT domain-containing protein [Candidatus Thermoplasmatota archaeon]